MRRCTVFPTLALAALLLVLAGCGPRQVSGPDLEQTELAVAGFMKPCESWQLLAGCLPENRDQYPDQVMQTLNEILADALAERNVSTYQGQAVVQQCQEIVLFEAEDMDMSGLEYWSRIGRCVPADLLLVPQLFEWRQRQGGEWGVDEPAKVVFDLYLLDVQKQKLVDRFHFEQEQQALSDNLLGLGRFFRRGGQWIKAEELAREGMLQGLEALGL